MSLQKQTPSAQGERDVRFEFVWEAACTVVEFDLGGSSATSDENETRTARDYAVVRYRATGAYHTVNGAPACLSFPT